MKFSSLFGRFAFSALIVAFSSSAFGADISFYGIGKQQNHVQTNTAAPSLTTVHFECFVDSSEPNVINSASIQLPSGSSRVLTAEGPDNFSFEDVFGSTASMNTLYGIGTYTLSINSDNDTNSFAQLSMPSDAYGSVPFITNYAAAQSINPASDFVLQWSSFSGGTVNDYIELEIEDMQGNEVFRAPQFGSSGALNGTSNSIAIPASTLTAGQAYQARIDFIKIVVFDTTSIPGANGVVFFNTKTSLNIGTVGSGGAGTIQFYGVVKMQELEQTSDSAPALSTNNPFQFLAMAQATTTNVITSASLQIPGGGTRTFDSEGSGRGWFFDEGFTTQAALNTAYTTGTYTMSINERNTNTYSVPLIMPSGSSDDYPNTPQLTNYTAAQSINPSNAFTLYWTTFSGGTTNDFVQVQINTLQDDGVYRSGNPGEPTALNGTSPSFLEIPANTLAPGTTYDLEVMFARSVSTDRASIPGAFGFAAYGKKTVAQIRTTGTAPVVELQAIGMVDGHFQFRFSSRPGTGYQIQWADVLPNWQNLWFTNATSSETIFTDTFGLNSQRFYRVEEMP